MTSRASNVRPKAAAVPSPRQLGAAPELAVLAVLDAAILSAIPALLAAQPELCAAAPDVVGSSPCACAADRAIQIALHLREAVEAVEAVQAYRLVLAEDPRSNSPLPF